MRLCGPLMKIATNGAWCLDFLNPLRSVKREKKQVDQASWDVETVETQRSQEIVPDDTCTLVR